MPKPKLTDKQKKFCLEYMKDLNATQAAIRAGYSKHTANRQAAENMSKPVIKAEIDKQKEKRSGRTKLTIDSVLTDLVEIKKQCMEKGDMSTATRVSELEGKHLGAWKERIEHTDKEGGPIEVKHRAILDHLNDDKEGD